MTATLHARTPEALDAAWRALREQEPKLRIRDAAARLNVSEAELLATRIGDGVVRLCCDVPAIFAQLEGLVAMALTRNDACVHESTGTYQRISFEAHAGLALGREIDLRIFHGRWKHAFAVVEPDAKGSARRSLQFFDAHGGAVHKVYAVEATDRSRWEAIVGTFDADDASRTIAVEPAPAPQIERPDAEIDVESFRGGWLALKDTHEYFGLTRRFCVGGVQALRLAPSGHALDLGADGVQRGLEVAAMREIPIMVFVGNPGMIQIRTGTVQKLVATPPWFNVLDPGFNLHLRTDAIASAWLVRKPTNDGIVTSVEAYDARGERIVQLFGERKPGKRELESWRCAADELARTEPGILLTDSRRFSAASSPPKQR